jgi:cytosine/adenosine deaminase-related metal-dependent hydrolase
VWRTARARAHGAPRAVPTAGLDHIDPRRPYALGLDDHVGTIEPGKLADTVVVDNEPVQQPELLMDAARFWLVLQLGEPGAGTAVEHDTGITGL